MKNWLWRLLKKESLGQLIRYGVVGLLHNGTGYAIYLGLTYLGMDPKLVITIFYPISVTIAFFGHRNWAFEHEGHISGAAIRYVLTLFVGYLLNLVFLYVLSDIYGIPHQLVQLGSILFVALFTFFIFKGFTFVNPEK